MTYKYDNDTMKGEQVSQKSEGKKMTTIKVSVEVAAVISNTVRRLKAQGRKSLTADQLLLELMQEKFPEDTQLILNVPKQDSKSDQN